jgi:Family of unknown function (DUF6455)
MDYASFCQRLADQPKLMSEMLDRIGLGEATVQNIEGGLAWLSASTKCVFCPAPKRCVDWLSGTSEADSPAEFCPNAKLFARYLTAT